MHQRIKYAVLLSVGLYCVVFLSSFNTTQSANTVNSESSCPNQEPIEVIVEVPTPYKSKVPYIVHFAKIDNNTNEFDFWEWLVIQATIINMKPDAIYFHVFRVPKNNKWWDSVKDKLIVKEVKPPTETPKGVKIKAIPNQSDFIKTQILVEYGGIYMDLDAIPLRPLNKFADTPFELVACHNFPETVHNVGFAVLIAHKNSSLLQDYQQRQWEEYNGRWLSAANLNSIIYEPQYINNVLIVPKDTFYPFSWQKPGLQEIFSPKQKKFDFKRTYILHYYNSAANKHRLLPRDPLGYVLTNDTNFANVVRPVVLQALEDGSLPSELVPEYYWDFVEKSTSKNDEPDSTNKSTSDSTSE